jgi:hypothetical protein
LENSEYGHSRILNSDGGEVIARLGNQVTSREGDLIESSVFPSSKK